MCVSFGSFLLTIQHLTACHIRIYGIIPIESGAPCACDVSRIPSAHIGPTRKVTGNVPRIKRRRNTGGFGDVTPSSGAPKRNIHLPFIDLPTLKKLKKPCEIHPLSALLQRFGKCTFFFWHKRVAESLSSIGHESISSIRVALLNERPRGYNLHWFPVHATVLWVDLSTFIYQLRTFRTAQIDSCPSYKAPKCMYYLIIELKYGFCCISFHFSDRDVAIFNTPYICFCIPLPISCIKWWYTYLR